jgi:hypothetical protein
MKVRYEEGQIRLNLHDLLAYVQPDQKQELIESLACDDDIITFVTQQILDKYTESGYSGGAYVVACADPVRGLDWAWREVARRSGEVAQLEIERLERALKSKDQDIRSLHETLREAQDRARSY